MQGVEYCNWFAFYAKQTNQINFILNQDIPEKNHNHPIGK